MPVLALAAMQMTMHGSRPVQLDLHADRVAEERERHGAGDAAI